MVYEHVPVMAREVGQFLNVGPHRRFLDGTLGGAGHSEQILIDSSPDGQVLGLDWDDEALVEARRRLARFQDRVTLRQSSFSAAREILSEIGWHSVHGAILDLGASSHQLRSEERGFSFRSQARLDMRMDRRNRWTPIKSSTRFRQLNWKRSSGLSARNAKRGASLGGSRRRAGASH